jgi:hypothetical protein
MSKPSPVHEETFANCTIRIIPDYDAESPDTWGNEDVFLVANHRSFTVRRSDWACDGETFRAFTAPDEARPKRWDAKYREAYDNAKRYYGDADSGLAVRAAGDDLRERQEEWDARVANSKRYYLSPLGAHIHGGVALCAGGVERDWDSGNIGYIVVDREAFKAEDGTLPDDKRCEEIAEGLVAEWNTYLEGRVFGYMIEHTISGDEESCWGFYCDDWAGKDCLAEARSMAKCLDKHYHADLAKERADGNDPRTPGATGDVDALPTY